MTDLFEQVAGHSAPAAERPSPHSAAASYSLEPGDLLAELDNEIVMRVRVFGRKVDDKSMRPEERDRRIAIIKRVRSQVAYLADNAAFFRACLRHRVEIEACLAVLDELEPARIA